MKKQWIVLAMALVMLLTGCQAETAIPADSLQDTEIEQTSSFSGGKTETTESESESSDMAAVTAGESEASSAETASLAETSEPPVQTESNHTVTTPEKKEETQTEPSEAPQKEPLPEATKPAETISESKPEEVVTPEPTMPPAPEPKSIYNYEFDVEAIRQELIAIGTEMGLTVDSSLTPGNASWANPVTASQSFQGSGLERSLKDYVRSMPSIITAYGGDPIQYFTVYAENLGGGSYCFYFLY